MSRSFTFFQSFADAANMMNDTDRLAFYDAIVGCAIYGEETDALPPAAHLVFTAIRTRAHNSPMGSNKGFWIY